MAAIVLKAIKPNPPRAAAAVQWLVEHGCTTNDETFMRALLVSAVTSGLFHVSPPRIDVL